MAARKPPARSLLDVVSSGDLRLTLEALRDDLALAILVADPQHKAPLHKQMRDTLEALAGLPVTKGSAVDDLAKRRAARKAAASSTGTEGR